MPDGRALWRVLGSASVILQSCSLSSADLRVQPAREHAAAAAGKQGATAPPAPLLLSVRWRRGAHGSDGAFPRCELHSEPPLLPAYVRSLEAMADGGSEASLAFMPCPEFSLCPFVLGIHWHLPLQPSVHAMQCLLVVRACSLRVRLWGKLVFRRRHVGSADGRAVRDVACGGGAVPCRERGVAACAPRGPVLDSSGGFTSAIPRCCSGSKGELGMTVSVMCGRARLCLLR